MATLKQEPESKEDRMNRLQKEILCEIDEQIRHMHTITEYKAKLDEWGCVDSGNPWPYGGELTIEVVVKEDETPRMTWDKDALEGQGKWVPAEPRQPRDESYTFFIDQNVKKELAPANYSGNYAHNPIRYMRFTNRLTGEEEKITNERDIKGILNMGLKLANQKLDSLFYELDLNATYGL